jgi:small subunit ribosomal protein S16
MAAVIRLQRRGSKKNPFYRIVVADKRRARDGRFIEILGTYNPVARGKQEELNVDVEKVDAWVKKGAQPSLTVKQLVNKARATGAASA